MRSSSARSPLIVYAVTWSICVLNRQTDLGIVVAASQAVFSEQVVSKWLRLEWQRIRFEKTYDDVFGSSSRSRRHPNSTR